MSEAKFELPDDKTFNDSINSLREDYNDYRNALGVRALTFFIILFTLLSTILNSEKVSGIFPNVLNVTLEYVWFGINLFNLLKLLSFIFLIMVVLYYAFRTFFRFVLTSKYINVLYWFKKDDLNKLPPDFKKEISQAKEKIWLAYLSHTISLKLAGKLEGHKREKILPKIHCDCFMPEFKFGHASRGKAICLGSASVATFLLLFIVW